MQPLTSIERNKEMTRRHCPVISDASELVNYLLLVMARDQQSPLVMFLKVNPE